MAHPVTAWRLLAIAFVAAACYGQAVTNGDDDPTAAQQAVPAVPAPARPLNDSSVAAKGAKEDAFTIEEEGAKNTTDNRFVFYSKGKMISPWHEIPLFADDGNLNFIVEIPKETTAKWEVNTHDVGNPIKQDITSKGKLRFYPYNIHWNYGLLPQTWEDPGIKNAELGNITGDHDPIDVVEIGSAQLETGGVYKVKPLGVLAMIDEGELDWKVIAINIDDPKAAMVNDCADIEKVFPGEFQKIVEWFRDYKIPDGKNATKFGYNGVCKDEAFTMNVIKETHEAYVHLKSGARPNTDELSLI
ncbi:hypothetical protein FOA52_003070 [Chlamydomonas sp. UWO 241]|nr:hypothetical protein FOA52_003070 [Chlamydomonas sp. UWO 241]